jgi:molybdenum cofactor biosynthesis enzyme MoaA
MNALPLTAADIEHRVARTRARWEKIPGKFRFPNQTLGRTQAIGCVALEITQKCNLDCTLCYLSENSESIPDLPMAELKRRADRIREEFGPGTNVQITGGDPTMRPTEELLEIVRYVRSLKLSPALFTNGIKATRKLLTRLKEAGLADVAFHVDLTQERPGYRTEVELNEVREEYIERARGLGLAVYFNTTVHKHNFHEIPDLVRFFVRHADVVSIASFQLQADTGRGTQRKREIPINLDNVATQINAGLGRALTWDGVQMGHPECHHQAYALIVGGKVVDLLDDPELIRRLIANFGQIKLDRTRQARAAMTFIGHVLATPVLWGPSLRFLGRKLRAHGWDFVKAGFRARKMMFFMQNFQDRDNLDPERIEMCSFHVMTQDGPVSMCQHNAHRDDYILPQNQPGVYPEGTKVVPVAPTACASCTGCH